MSETINSTEVYGQLIIAFTLPTQWRSREGDQVGTRASGRNSWGRINTLNSAI